MNFRSLRRAALAFVRRRAVFCASAALAAASAVAVPPSPAYVGYIDWGTLSVLFSLMAAVSGFSRAGVFGAMARPLCRRAADVRSVSAALVALCFLSSMLVTNDVALIAFVPFAVTLLRGIPPRTMAFVVVLQTVAANMGSMLTPVGNPQNLFLFGASGMPLAEFVSLTAPYAAASAVLLAPCLLLVPRDPLPATAADSPHMADDSDPSIRHRRALHVAVHCAVFALSVAAVAGAFPRETAAPAALVLLLAFDRRAILGVDFFLLLTFCAFFVFSGNLAAVGAVRSFLEGAVRGSEFAVSLAASQVLSNVPSALMLFRFSSDVRQLVLGVDIGGLGTPVASLASLISLSFAVSRGGVGAGLFLAVFSAVNIAFLAALVLLRLLIS